MLGTSGTPEDHLRKKSLTFHGEIFRRDEHGQMSCTDKQIDDGRCITGAGAGGGSLEGEFRARQSGGYWQAVYQFMPEWRVGYRYDRLNPGQAGLTALSVVTPAAQSYRPTKYSLMTDYSPNASSRFRLQFSQDKSQQGITDRQLTLQYIFTLGAHRSHDHDHHDHHDHPENHDGH